MPLGLVKIRMPLADKEPKISLELFPVTLLSRVEELVGWIKLTVSPVAMLKELKLMTVLSAEVIFKVLWSGEEKVATPASTSPPSGMAKREFEVRAARVNNSIKGKIFCIFSILL